MLLQGLGSSAARLHDPGQDGLVMTKVEPGALRACGEEPLWDYSVHISEFIRDFVTDRGSKYASTDTSGVILALMNLADVINGPPRVPGVPLGDPSHHEDRESHVPYTQSNIPMPPL